MIKKIFSFITLAALTITVGCTWEKPEPEKIATCYPADVEAIIVNKCATAGCHNALSKAGAGGLNMETWATLFEGGNLGSSVIPYRPDYSTLLYYTNTDTAQGLVLQPTMPYNANPLSNSEYETLRNWIINGAPDCNGTVWRSDYATRKKVYVTNQGCDVVSVFDAQTKLVMRMKDVGKIAAIESPHSVKVAPNNQFWCVSFIGGSYFQKFSTADNSLLGEVNIGLGSWNTFAISPDSKKAYTVDLSLGKIVEINLLSMTKTPVPNLLVGSPHGTWLNETGDTLFITNQGGGNIWKAPTNDLSNQIPISFPGYGSSKFHEIVFSPNKNFYYLTDDFNHQILVVNANNNSVVAQIPVGTFPQEMAISTTKPYLFVTCVEDLTTFPGKRGSVYVIDYNTNTVVRSIYTGHQPHGIALDDANGLVFVANRNNTTGGPAPHHSSVCGGQNGSVVAIDLNTLNLVPGFSSEVSVDPYGVGVMY
ncbi:MAG TPA: YncE family protein [Bacteroidia bacterium]|nr:YncE family protein [Bacteroidia bacterium]HNU34284.1 YncE family protein [Bacteroidia bacterium]